MIECKWTKVSIWDFQFPLDLEWRSDLENPKVRRHVCDASSIRGWESLAVTVSHHQRASEDHTTLSLGRWRLLWSGSGVGRYSSRGSRDRESSLVLCVLPSDTVGPGGSRLRESPQLPEQLHPLCRAASARRGWCLRPRRTASVLGSTQRKPRRPQRGQCPTCGVMRCCQPPVSEGGSTLSYFLLLLYFSVSSLLFLLSSLFLAQIY